MPTIEAIQRHYRLLQECLVGVSELEPAFDLLSESSEYGSEVYLSYVALITQMAGLTGADSARISQSQQWMEEHGVVTGSASSVGANDIVSELADRKSSLVEIAERSVDPQSAHYQAAVQTLVTKLEGGHKLKVSGKEPSDTDPESLKVIWGHTVITGREALVHFVTCHYLGLYFAAEMKAMGLSFASQKDFFVNALADVVLLDHLRSGESDQVYDIWSRPKQDGGMGWINDDRRASYGL